MHVVDEDIEFFRLILSFQFIKELQMNFLIVSEQVRASLFAARVSLALLSCS